MNNQQPPKGQELQVVKEAVNLGIANLQFEEKEKVIHCFRTIQVQLQQFEQLKQEHEAIKKELDETKAEYERQYEDLQKLPGVAKQVEGKPKNLQKK